MRKILADRCRNLYPRRWPNHATRRASWIPRSNRRWCTGSCTAAHQDWITGGNSTASTRRAPCNQIASTYRSISSRCTRRSSSESQPRQGIPYCSANQLSAYVAHSARARSRRATGGFSNRDAIGSASTPQHLPAPRHQAPPSVPVQPTESPSSHA